MHSTFSGIITIGNHEDLKINYNCGCEVIVARVQLLAMPTIHRFFPKNLNPGIPGKLL